MGVKIEKLKNETLKSCHHIKQSSTKSYLVLKDKSLLTFNYTSNLKNKAIAYFKSSDCEQDLDLILNLLYSFQPSKMPKFEEFKFRDQRVLKKGQLVKNQLNIYFTVLGAIGYKIGLIMSGTTGATIGFSIAVGAGIIIVLIVGGSIVINRYQSIANCPQQYLTS